jgi:hypothetical protein
MSMRAMASRSVGVSSRRRRSAFETCTGLVSPPISTHHACSHRLPEHVASIQDHELSGHLPLVQNKQRTRSSFSDPIASFIDFLDILLLRALTKGCASLQAFLRTVLDLHPTKKRSWLSKQRAASLLDLRRCLALVVLMTLKLRLVFVSCLLVNHFVFSRVIGHVTHRVPSLNFPRRPRSISIRPTTRTASKLNDSSSLWLPSPPSSTQNLNSDQMLNFLLPSQAPTHETSAHPRNVQN